MYKNSTFIAFAATTALLLPSASHAFPLSMPDVQNASVTAYTQISASQSDEAKKFVSSLAAEGVEFLNNASLSDDQRREEFSKLLKKNFDVKTIARFALGKNWRSASAEEQKEYLSLFEEMIVNVYSRRFGEYNGERLDVTAAREINGSDSLVSSVIVPKNGPKISLEWRIREKNGRMKVVDLIVEGVSMSMTQRSDFSSVIQRGGGNIDALLAHLRGK